MARSEQRRACVRLAFGSVILVKSDECVCLLQSCTSVVVRPQLDHNGATMVGPRFPSIAPRTDTGAKKERVGFSPSDTVVAGDIFFLGGGLYILEHG